MFVEFCTSHDADACSLSQEEFTVIENTVEAIDSHMSSNDTTGQDVHVALGPGEG